MANKHVLGIDIGGSGIKGAPVNLKKGELVADRLRIETPAGASPDDVVDVVVEVVEAFSDQVDRKSPVGIAVPGVVQRGVLRSAANIDKSWIDADADALFTERLGRPVHVVNDADAAGEAEVHYGVGQGEKGVVLLTTLGTGIGSALFVGGQLVPNTELGHLEIDGHNAESRAASSAREREQLSWEQWAERLQRYYSVVEALLWPDLIIVGGGVSRRADMFLPLLDLRARIVPARLRNRAGIIGAAWHAEHLE